MPIFNSLFNIIYPFSAIFVRTTNILYVSSSEKSAFHDVQSMPLSLWTLQGYVKYIKSQNFSPDFFIPTAFFLLLTFLLVRDYVFSKI